MHGRCDVLICHHGEARFGVIEEVQTGAAVCERPAQGLLGVTDSLHRIIFVRVRLSCHAAPRHLCPSCAHKLQPCGCTYVPDIFAGD
jgi:hypothetical protein